MSITIAAEFIPGNAASAVIARLRDVTNIMALCGDITVNGKSVRRVAGEFHPTEQPRHWIVVRHAGGLPADPPLERPRITVYHYATSGIEAARLVGLVEAVLTPLYRQGSWFVGAGCFVSDVARASGLIPVPQPEPLRAWECYAVDYMLLVNQGVRAA